uniref:Uncharacterized protein n=1 Tax=Aegilops tauschii subsp. strangulata TaxID=200361 RepID=A0A453KFJ3_AEGTS
RANLSRGWGRWRTPWTCPSTTSSPRTSHPPSAAVAAAT